MDEITERIENNFINIYNKFDILDKKLNNYHIKIDKINEIIDLIISDEYTKIYKTYYPMKNYDLSQDRFFIYSEIIDIPLKANTYFILLLYMALYYRKPINKVVDDVKLKIQLGALTLKISKNNDKIDSLLTVDKNIIKDVSSNLEKIDNIKEFLLSSENFKKTFNIEKQIFRFNRTSHFYIIFEKEITYDFTKNSLLFIDNNIQYKYENLSNDYHRLQHEYNINDDEDNLIYKYLFNKDTYHDENQNPILLTIDDFCIYF